MSTYTPITWSDGDPITPERMNQHASNEQYLFNKSIDAKHVFDGVERTTGVKIWAGNGRFERTGTTRSVIDFNWDGFFSTGCQPIVNVTVGRRDRNRLWVSVKGIGASNWPDSRGCQVHGIMDPDANYTFSSIFLPIHVIAIGY